MINQDLIPSPPASTGQEGDELYRSPASAEDFAAMSAEELTAHAERQRATGARHREDGMQALQRADIASAKEAFALALAAYPADTETLYQIGLIAEAENPGALNAKACYCAVLAIDPTHSPADDKLRRIYTGNATP